MLKFEQAERPSFVELAKLVLTSTENTIESPKNKIGKDGTAKVKQVLNPSATKLKRTFKRGKRKERRAGQHCTVKIFR